MISYREAIEIITAQIRLLEAETVSIENAVGRILTENILSPEFLPPFSNSAMDGFAYRQKDLDHSERWTLNIQGTLAAGDSFSPEAKTVFQGAWEIMTGAQVPSDCDCVIKVEETQRNGSQVTLLKRGSSGDNLREAGADFKVGDPIAVKGTRLLPEHLMAFAAWGSLTSTSENDPRFPFYPLVPNSQNLLKKGPEKFVTPPPLISWRSYVRLALSQHFWAL